MRGQLLPVVDLRAFLGSGATNTSRNTRVMVVNHREMPAGLVVDEVLGFRRFAEGEFSATRRRRSRVASAISRARSAAARRAGRC